MNELVNVITDGTRSVDQNLLKIAFASILLFIAYKIFSHFVERTIKFQKKLLKAGACRRNTTVLIMVRNIVKYLIGIILVLYSLTLFGIDTTTWLAGLGIAGLLIGLALQDTARDFLQGFFIITEGQFSVGDTVEVRGFRGEVIAIGLKSTQIKDYKGTVCIFANRDITQVMNYSAENSLAEVTVLLDCDVDTEKVDEIFNNLVEKIESINHVVGPVRYLGLDKVEANGHTFKMTAETAPSKHFEVRRKMIKEIQKTLSRNKINSKSIETE